MSNGQGSAEKDQGSAQAQEGKAQDDRRRTAARIGRGDQAAVAPLSQDDARAATLALLARRAAGATLCPSEVARALAAAAGSADWRGEMAGVHAAVERLVADGLVRLSWKGAPRQVGDGPYRIGRAAGA